MSEKETITFFVSKTLKKGFEEKTKNSGFTVSSALRELMKRYIEEPTLISSSSSKLSADLESRIQRIEHTSTKELKSLRQEIKSLRTENRDFYNISQKSFQQSLQEEILGILKVDKTVKQHTYFKTEKAILKNYPNLKVRILTSKSKGNDPVSEAINQLRELKLVKYNLNNKRLTWV